MSRTLQLSGFTRDDRLSVTARLIEAIRSAGGWILDHHQFSNVSLCIHFELDGACVPALVEALDGTGVRLTRDSFATLAALPAPSGACACSIQVAFVNDEPDLRIYGPPG